MKKPRFAIPSFPGSNGEVDNLRTLRRCGFDAFVFRWNEDKKLLEDVDGYFFGAGFSYEDRGRSGMVAARDPLFEFMRSEAGRGKVIIGNCNGAQVLVESGLVPLGDALRFCLARNAYREGTDWRSPGFLNEWVWITPSCSKDRCATSHWSGALHMPIAHGEGRFITKDSSLIAELQASGQIAFQYCDEAGTISSEHPMTPNGSTLGIAGICNEAGNVVALMPHPERTASADAYFLSIHEWLKHKGALHSKATFSTQTNEESIQQKEEMTEEIFIETIITNNEERTVEQALRRSCPDVVLKQYRYIALNSRHAEVLLSRLSFFNPHKEIAYVRRGESVQRWDSSSQKLLTMKSSPLLGHTYIRRDMPDTLGASLGNGCQTGICYDCRNVDRADIERQMTREVLCNPNASTLERLLHA